MKYGIGKQREILIVVYSDLIHRFQKEFRNVGYFGNLKGFNDFKDLYRMAHVGMNRFPNMAYYFIYCGSHMEEYHRLSEMGEDESLDFFTLLSKNHNKEYEYIINKIMLRCMLADFEQNIFRLAIRNFESTDNVHIWTFYNTDDYLYSELSAMIEDRYKPYGALFEYEDTPEELKIEKVKDRKPPNGKKMTNAQKIISWCENQDQGTIFKIGTLLADTGLSNNSFKETRKSNTVIKKMFDEMKTERQGYYKIS